uniref:peptidoglycan bridge formation glycyltransferase FemA/FemB family protein n=1 Tax=Staphylococcus hominis TaxID=1290 RepID=UPI000B2578D8
KLAYILSKDYFSTPQHKHEDLTKHLTEIAQAFKESPNSKKNKNKRTQLHQQFDINVRQLSQTKDKFAAAAEVLNLAAALYTYIEHEVYYLSSGSNPNYNDYMGAYRLQWEMIKFAIEHNIDRYNFYGITGDFSENAEDYGVQQFKKGFNAG